MIFNLKNLLDSPYDAGQNEALVMKIRAGVLNIRPSCLGPFGPTGVIRSQTPRYT